MKVLVACERSGVVRDAFRRRGHEAWSCDLRAAVGVSEYHIIGDAVEVAYEQSWDLMIAHPPCTRLTNAGVRWLDVPPKDRTLADVWRELEKGTELFMKLYKAPIKMKALENPIPHLYAKLPPYTQIIHPWQHGHGESKATCLWLEGLPPIEPSNIVSGRLQRIHALPPSEDRSDLRSVTYDGIADAFAEQWTRPFHIQAKFTF